MIIGNIEITPQNGISGTNIPISVKLLSANDDLDKVVRIRGFVGNKTADFAINLAGNYEPLEASDGVLIDTSDSPLWAKKA